MEPISTTEHVEKELTFREALLPPSLRELRQKLRQKAKQQKRFRFYSLYELVCRMDTLEAAWAAVKRNDGAPGVDGVSIERMAATSESEAAFLLGIQESLRKKTYQAKAVLRVYIPKPNGKQRPLGIPTVRDRVVQMATKLVIEPIFEADFQPCSYGFRPKRSATQALEAIREAGNRGLNFVVDADIQGYFDSIQRETLLELLKERLSDRRVLKLIRQWLEAGVMEDGTVRETLAGTPQGGVMTA